MSQWNLFPQWEERDDSVRQFAETERSELESLVAGQVSGLLRYFGILGIHEIDNVMYGLPDENENTGYIDDTKSFYGIELPAIKLEDDGLLLIGQFPRQFGKFCTEKGALSVTKLDELGEPVFESTVWGSFTEKEPKIQNSDGHELEIPVLQELYETLIICFRNKACSVEENAICHNIARYPEAVVEPELEELEELFYE